ncbi:MAG: hypothetical protein RLZ42_1345 [Armatimonadota bacterium]
MSAHGGRNLRVNKKYTRQESNLRLWLLCICKRKINKIPRLFGEGMPIQIRKIHPAGIEPATNCLEGNCSIR